MGVRHSKRYRKALEQVDREKQYELVEGINLLKNLAKPKFEEAVDLAIRLGIDPKKTDQLIRGSVSLPKGIGKTLKVICFADGEKAREAKEAGADEVGSEELAKKVEGGWTDFDVAVAAPDMMRFVGKLGRVLGPQGKMPSPKAGTVTNDVAKAVREFKAGKIEFRTDAGANGHARVGKRSFSSEDLAENVSAFLEHIRGLKPAQSKGNFILKVTISSTMGPGIPLGIR
jgi:large subunit ribosomal protein L1